MNYTERRLALAEKMAKEHWGNAWAALTYTEMINEITRFIPIAALSLEDTAGEVRAILGHYTSCEEYLISQGLVPAKTEG